MNEIIQAGVKTMKKLPCTCGHKWQDLTFGAGIRQHNMMTSKKGSGGRPFYRCVVCGKEREAEVFVLLEESKNGNLNK